MKSVNTNLESLTAEQILKISCSEPERLFARDRDTARAGFRRLVRRWHPDRCTHDRAAQVFQHILALHKAAKKAWARSTWHEADRLEIRASDGRHYRLRYLRRRDFELGEMYICRRSLAFVVNKAHSDLFANAEQCARRFRFATPEMREEAEPFLPCIRDVVETDEAQILLVDKAEDLVLLGDLVEHLGSRLDGRHAAWVVSALLILACYLDYAGLVHGAIGPDSVFVSPRQHTGSLLGGWWYAAPAGARFRALPERSAGLIDARSLAQRTADHRLDLVLIRALGREILGDSAGARLAAEGQVPPAIANWLRMPSSGSAIEDYQSWQEALSAGYGARRFVELAVAPSDIYC